MDFEFFKEEGRGYEPKASIRKQGQIGLNQGAVTRFKIKNNQNVVLGYDRSNKTIAIKLVDEAEKGSKRVVVRSKNQRICRQTIGIYDALLRKWCARQAYQFWHKSCLETS